jgi:hypothetical protein
LKGFERDTLISIPWRTQIGPFENFRFLAQVLGLEEVDLYVSPRKTLESALIPSQPLALILSEEAGSLKSPAAQRFLWGRLAALAKWGYALALFLSEVQLRRLYLLMAKTVREDLILEGYEEKAIRSDLRRIRRGLPKKIRQDLEGPVDRFLKELRRVDFHRWREGLIRSANRFGLLVSQDLKAALEVLAWESPASSPLALPSGHGFREFLSANPRAMALFKFHGSSEYFELREHFGMAQTGLLV